MGLEEGRVRSLSPGSHAKGLISCLRGALQKCIEAQERSLVQKGGLLRGFAGCSLTAETCCRVELRELLGYNLRTCGDRLL